MVRKAVGGSERPRPGLSLEIEDILPWPAETRLEPRVTERRQ